MYVDRFHIQCASSYAFNQIRDDLTTSRNISNNLISRKFFTCESTFSENKNEWT